MLSKRLQSMHRKEIGRARMQRIDSTKGDMSASVEPSFQLDAYSFDYRNIKPIPIIFLRIVNDYGICTSILPSSADWAGTRCGQIDNLQHIFELGVDGRPCFSTGPSPADKVSTSAAQCSTSDSIIRVADAKSSCSLCSVR